MPSPFHIEPVKFTLQEKCPDLKITRKTKFTKEEIKNIMSDEKMGPTEPKSFIKIKPTQTEIDCVRKLSELVRTGKLIPE